MPEWVVALIGIFCTVGGALIMFTLVQDRRITRLEERNKQLGDLLRQLPKRKTDRIDG
jgi:hypothetical protein